MSSIFSAAYFLVPNMRSKSALKQKVDKRQGYKDIYPNIYRCVYIYILESALFLYLKNRITAGLILNIFSTDLRKLCLRKLHSTSQHLAYT